MRGGEAKALIQANLPSRSLFTVRSVVPKPLTTIIKSKTNKKEREVKLRDKILYIFQDA
jgi:hypothetical protein